MTVRDLTYEIGWLTLAGLLVSFHRLAMGFYLSDADASGFHAIALVGLGGLSAVVLTGAQMVLAATLAKVHDRLLEVAWWTLLVCAVIVMTASTLASMHHATLAEVMKPDWLAAHPPAVILAVGLSLAIEISLASIRRASMLLEQSEATTNGLRLSEHEIAELEVQRELARHRGETPAAVESEDDVADGPDSGGDIEPTGDVEEADGVIASCSWCHWTTTRPTQRGASSAVNAHLRFCPKRP